MTFVRKYIKKNHFRSTNSPVGAYPMAIIAGVFGNFGISKVIEHYQSQIVFYSRK